MTSKRQRFQPHQVGLNGLDRDDHNCRTFVGPSDRGLNQGKLRDRVDADALAGIAEKGELRSTVVMPRVWKKQVSKALSAYPLSSRPCAGPHRRARPELMNCVFRFNGAPRMIDVDRGVMR
jgi:hypothetical protein